MEGEEYKNLGFPFLFGGTFIEGYGDKVMPGAFTKFPFLFGGTFIEGSVYPVVRR